MADNRSLTLNQRPELARLGGTSLASGREPAPPASRSAPFDASCGTCGTRCIDSAGGPRSPDGNLAYVGSGRGRFVQETTYRYVGLKDADSNPLRDSSLAGRFLQGALACCCLTCLLVGLLAWANISGVLQLGGGSPSAADTERGSNASNASNASRLRASAAGRGKAGENCTATSEEESKWSLAQADWCCNNYGRGCSGHGRSYHCSVGADDWERAWSDSKKRYCCGHRRVGCASDASTTTREREYNCEIGFDHWAQVWSLDQKVYCCIHHSRGCPTRPPLPPAPPQTTRAPFDCNVGFRNWRAGWSGAKQQWCCDHARRGCPEPAASPPPAAPR